MHNLIFLDLRDLHLQNAHLACVPQIVDSHLLVTVSPRATASCKLELTTCILVLLQIQRAVAMDEGITTRSRARSEMRKTGLEAPQEERQVVPVQPQIAKKQVSK